MAEKEEPDEDEEPAPDAFGGEEALAKVREGKDAWNAWAEENPGRAVDFRGVDFTFGEKENFSFEGFTFPGDVSFCEGAFQKARFKSVTFGGCADFQRAIFNGDAGFQNSTFNGSTKFLGATFKRHAGFGGATFKNLANFLGVSFESSVSLESSSFHTVPDFRRSKFSKHVTLYNTDIQFTLPTKADHADKYRRLKEIAVIARDHDSEQKFFAYELIAKRGHEARSLKLIPNYLYGCLSDFGRSGGRPFAWLFGAWIGFGVLYNWVAVKDWSHIWDGLLFSAANLFPFLGASRGALADARTALYGEGPLSVGVHALGIVEGILGVLFIFLIGLALRNRFRI
ncbi:MAG: pentapeptide repeat-containing protein [Rhodospirillales bacterium]|nr:pentapeptide repeat-containing protein [Rhodospirillales bacterium]